MTSVLPRPTDAPLGDGPPNDPASSLEVAKLKEMSKKELANEIIKQTSATLKTAEKLPLEQALNALLAAEKKARLASHFESVWNVVTAILNLVSKDIEQLLFYVKLLFRKRAQSEKVCEQVVSYVTDKILPNYKGENEIKLLATLRELSSGKMTLEKLRSTLTLRLSKIHYANKSFEEANKILQSESPETYSTLDQRTKNEFLIEQLKMSILVGDYFRGGIIADKISNETLSRWVDLKLEFNGLMIDFYTHQRSPFQLAKSSFEILKIYLANGDSAQMKNDLLNKVVIYLASSEKGKDQIEMINYLTVKVLKNPTDDFEESLMKLVKANWPTMKVLKYFIGQEIINFPLPEMKALNFGDPANVATSAKAAASMVVNEKNWVFLKFFEKIIEHDITIISSFYTHIKISKMASMILVDERTLEEYISNMVNDEKLHAKMDRPNGTIKFGKPQSADEILDQWSGDVSHLLQLVDKTCYLIEKENMLQHAGISK